MTTYFFDASSLVNLAKRGVVGLFIDGATLDLALYESFNAIWSEYRLLGRLDEDTALTLLDIVGGVFEVLEVLSIRGFEREAFDLASEEGRVLVTDDRKLRDRASRYVRVVSSGELASRFSR